MKLNKRKCKNCGEVFQKMNKLQFVCSVSCAVEYSRKKMNEKEPRVRKRGGVKNTYPEVYINENKKKLQQTINKIARLIDKGAGCIDCGIKNTQQWDGGHYHSVGAHPEVRFNLFNIHIQASHCNKFKNHINDYKEGLIRTYGNEYFEMVENLPLRYSLLKIPASDYPGLKTKANKVLKDLKLGNKIYSSKDRIKLREEINQIIGIYC